MGKFGTWVASHRKAIAGAVSAIGGILAFVASQQSLGKWAQYAGVGLAVLGAAGVYRVPNAQPAAVHGVDPVTPAPGQRG